VDVDPVGASLLGFYGGNFPHLNRYSQKPASGFGCRSVW
jgi:hypothetical protein